MDKSKRKDSLRQVGLLVSVLFRGASSNPLATSLALILPSFAASCIHKCFTFTCFAAQASLKATGKGITSYSSANDAVKPAVEEVHRVVEAEFAPRILKTGVPQIYLHINRETC